MLKIEIKKYNDGQVCVEVLEVMGNFLDTLERLVLNPV